jgi:hypothetical protein
MTGECIEPSDRRCSVLLYHVGQCGFRPLFLGVWSPWDGPSVMVLTAQVPDGLDPLWWSPLLPGQTYPMSKLSWRLCMFMFRICYARWWWNILQYLSTCCQVCVGSCGHVLSCHALNVTASRGPSPSGTYPVLKAPGCGCWGPEHVPS